MHILKIDNDENFLDLAPVWDRLVATAGTNTLFLTHDWLASWWKTYGTMRKLFLLLLKDGEEIRAIAPLMVKNYKIFRRLSFIGGHRSDYADFIVHKDRSIDYESFLRHLLLHREAYDEIMLENVPETSPLLSALEKYSSHFIIRKKISDVCPYMIIDEHSGELLRKMERTQSLKRKRNKLIRMGKLCLRHYTEQGEMEKALRPLFESYLQRFDKANLMKRLPLEIDFHRELLHRMNSKDMIRFSSLELDGLPIARHLGFHYQGVYHWMRPAFDPSFSKYSPGLVMLYHLIEHAIRNGYREFDFLRGDEPFKTRLTSQVRRVFIIRVYASFSKYLTCRIATGINRWLQGLTFRQK